MIRIVFLFLSACLASPLWGAGGQGQWVRLLSTPVPAGPLEGCVVTVWPSHGRYYDAREGAWAWQRPPLWGTREDLLTQTFTAPYLMPMLEQAGAVVFTPRERDWQRRCAVVDYDGSARGVYKEGGAWETDTARGFAYREVYEEGENPFRMGTVRRAKASRHPSAAAVWEPQIDEAGRYAVYVSYKTTAESVSDAHYTVVHEGVRTRYAVNQRIGGSTWVYLGTHEFDTSGGDRNCVILTNESQEDGYVTADATRLGGGTGCIAREGQTSHMARHYEGARYALQYAGFPEAVYHHFESDYTDDYTCRAHAVNYLDTALHVRSDLALAIHSDAGYTLREDSIIGTMTIVTSWGRDSIARAQLAQATLQTIYHDLTQLYGTWTAREARDANYAETRIPSCIAMIVETLSHQNEADVRLARRPDFKFHLSRAIYKAVVRFLRPDAPIEPLPPTHFAAHAEPKTSSVALSWEPQDDPLEPSAHTRGYIIYKRDEREGWDNGTYTTEREYRYTGLTAGRTYRFRVRAAGEGGVSHPTEELCARIGQRGEPETLIAVRAPRYALPLTPEYCGRQTGYDTLRAGQETEGALGYSGSEREGQLTAGERDDYPFRHAQSLVGTVSSVSLEALDEVPKGTDLVDLILGPSHEDPPRAARRAIARHIKRGGKLIQHLPDTQ